MAKYIVYAPTRGVPPLGAVLTPTMGVSASASESRGRIFGQPGTQAIPAPIPSAVPQQGGLRSGAGTSRSKDAPPIIFPAIYYEADFPKEHAPVSRVSDNQMPVPALRAPNVIKSNPYQARKGGQRQVFQPQIVQRWLPMRGTQ